MEDFIREFLDDEIDDIRANNMSLEEAFDACVDDPWHLNSERDMTKREREQAWRVFCKIAREEYNL